MVAETRAEDKNLQSVLSQQHYKIDYYQREYVWETKQVEELMSDFLTRFHENYEPSHDLNKVLSYDRYFLGSLILSQSEQNIYIIDGQQRLSTLTLLFIALMHRSQELGIELNGISDYIYSTLIEQKSFNISVEGRNEIMQNLLDYPESQKIDPEHKDEALVGRYFDLIRILKKEVPVDIIKHFYYWLSHRVMLVRIMAHDAREAYSIFETMNDRGKPLTPLDMFKGYTLSLIDNREDRHACQEVWKTAQKRLGDKMDQFVIDLLRAKYAQSESRGQGGDWTYIGQSCHRWFKENREKEHVNLSSSQDIVSFLKSFDYYSGLYERIQNYIERPTPGYESISYYGSFHKTALPTLMSVIEDKDPQEQEKLNLMATFMDIRTAQQSWNNEGGIDEANTAASFLRIIKQVRSHPEHEDANVLAWILIKLLENWDGFNANRVPMLTKRKSNQRGIYFLLARITTFLEIADGRQNPWETLSTKRSRYDIEHLLASNHEHNIEHYPTQEELDAVRNSIGALGLLDKSTNSSLNNSPYSVKVNKYAEHNRLLGILSPSLYKEGTNVFENHPKLERLRNSNPDLQTLMRPYASFTRESILERTSFMRHLAEIIWDANRLLEYTDFDNFEDIEGYSYNDEFDESIIEEVTQGGNLLYAPVKPTHTKRPSTAIKSSAPGETVKVKAHVTMRGVYDTQVYAEANHKGKVRIRKIIGLISRPLRTPMPHVEEMRDDMIQGRIGHVDEAEPGVYNWEGSTDWIPPSRALAIVRAIPSDLRPWELDE